MPSTTLTYEGPRALIVELEREVNFGDTFTVDSEIAPKLLLVQGIREAKPAEARKAKEEED